MRSEDSLVTVLLSSRSASDGLQPLKASEFWTLLALVGQPRVLLGQSEEQLVHEHALAPALAARVVALVGRATALAFELDRLDQSGIATLTPSDVDYPARFVERLGAKAPPVLHAAGNLALFARPGLGIVGSRDVSVDGVQVAESAARVAAGLGVAVVSGGARGVDQIAMHSARVAGGTVVAFLAESLTRTVRNPDVRRALVDGSTLMCTPYGPDAPFSAGNAMGRNKLIYAQSLVALVVASDKDKGGTWSGAIDAISGSVGRVAVWRGDGEGMGNAELAERGAVPVGSVEDLENQLKERR